MTKNKKTKAVKVLKELAEQRGYQFKTMGKTQWGNFAIADDFDIEVIATVYHNAEKDYFAIIHPSFTRASLFEVKRLLDLFDEWDKKVNNLEPIYDYDYSVIRSVEKWYMHNDEPISETEVNKLPPSTVLSRYLEWEGIIGYNDIIKSIFSKEPTYERKVD